MKIIIFILLVLFPIANDNASATRGCCSWHGGVASCDKTVGRLVCRDGTYSPSCVCEKIIRKNPKKTHKDLTKEKDKKIEELEKENLKLRERLKELESRLGIKITDEELGKVNVEGWGAPRKPPKAQ